MNSVEQTIKILLFLLVFISLNLFAQDTLIFSDIDGVIAVEAEHYFSREKTEKRQWYHTYMGSSVIPLADGDPNHSSTASSGGYLEILPDTRRTHEDPLVVGVSFSNIPGVLAIVSYNVNFKTTGKYYVWVRAYSTGTEDNGIHVGIDGTWPSSGARMQWCDGKNTWYWESKQRTDANHCGEPYKIFIEVDEPGVHTVSFSMREDGFEFDKWLLTTDRNYKPTGAGPDELILTDVGQSRPSSSDYDLNPNYPNPFNPNTTISFSLKKSSDILLSIYDINGELIKNLLNDYYRAGNYSIDWDGTNYYGNKVSSGVYLTNLLVGEVELIDKMILSK